MPKTPKTIFVCQSCGFESPRWLGQCSPCGGWNTFVETVVSASSAKLKKSFPSEIQISNPHLKAQNLSQIEAGASSRISTGVGEFDRVLGGGIVPGSVILLAGEPGVGKSTLLLQVAASLNSPTSPNSQTPYVSGEESPSQIRLRADRLRIKTDNIPVLAETDVDVIIYTLQTLYTLIIIDSVQTLATQDLSAPAGSISQVRECSRRLAQMAKETSVPVILVGHVTKDGAIAGPKVLEHLVDVVLNFEGDRFHELRLLRAAKNRFGSTEEVGVFKMGSEGLTEVKNPSNTFLSERLTGASGSVVTATMEGSRPVLVEIQALATPTSLAYPRRTSSGFDYHRLNLLIAVLQRHLKLNLHQKDTYVNVASGYKIDEPAADLAVALAITSSVKDQPIGASVCAFGEVGLSGEVRKVSQSDRRIKEAKKLGFSKIISPENVRSVAAATTAAQI